MPAAAEESQVFMPDHNELLNKIDRLEGQDFGGYQSLIGRYDFPKFTLSIKQIPKDPYAPPHTGIYCIRVRRDDPDVINIPTDSAIRKTAFCDYLVRRFYNASAGSYGRRRGTGYSGIITINQPGQCILDRNAAIIDAQLIELRIFIGLPANGRTINATLAHKMIEQELPGVVASALFTDKFDPAELTGHIAVAEDADSLRNRLDEMGLVCFIAEGAVLPRAAGFTDEPVSRKEAVPFTAPDSLRVSIDLPNAGKVSGMGIPAGVTLIVGGGYHGKSTLLQAIASGIYNHIPGDGREYTVALPEAVKIRAFSGRYVTGVDISPFIRNLPLQKDTAEFSTENASGSTSQAAAIIEAIEMGGRLLLMDEDTCATNFMIRDAKMQRLVAKQDEPITAFIDRVRYLFEAYQISTILVLGGAGDYFAVADRVIQMKHYQPCDVTLKAHEIERDTPRNRTHEDIGYPFVKRMRIPLRTSIDPHNAYGKKAIYSTDKMRLNFGREVIDLSDVEQLMELSQTRALGAAIDYARKYADETTSVSEIAAQVIADIEAHGLDVLSDRINGNYACFRTFEFAAALNRLRSLKVTQRSSESDGG